MKSFSCSIASIFALVFTCTLPQALMAIETNPQIRLCRQLQGQFIVVETPNDQVGLCQLGAGYMGSLDLVKYLTENTLPMSIESYSSGSTTCDPLGTSRTVLSLENNEFRVCIYKDGSIVEMTTLQKGKGDPSHIELDQALGL